MLGDNAASSLSLVVQKDSRVTFCTSASLPLPLKMFAELAYKKRTLLRAWITGSWHFSKKVTFVLEAHSLICCDVSSVVL